MQHDDTTGTAGTSFATPQVANQIAHHIRAWRKFKGLTGKEVGDRCVPKLTSSMITQLEKGRSGYSQRSLENIAKVLGCEPWQLLFSEPQQNMDDWVVLRAAMVSMPLYQEAQQVLPEGQRHWIERLFKGAMQSAVIALSSMVDEHRPTKEEAA